MNIGELYVRLTADAKGVKKGTDEAERSLNSFAGVAAKVGGVIAGLFAGQELAQFISSSVREATAADAVWNRLGGTLRNAGVEFGGVRGEIERMANQLENTTKVGDEEFASTLQTLTRITGDYRRSLQEVATVADVAAGAQISLETAAQLVGKVMVGETGTLKRYGIVVGEGADAMEVLRQRFAGMAEVEGQTLEGQIVRLNNEWGNFKEAIGDALTGGEGMIGVIRRLATYIENATTNLNGLVAKLQAAHGWLVKYNTLANRFGMGFIGENTGAIRLPAQTAVGPNRAPGGNTAPLIPTEAVDSMESLATALRASLPEFIKLAQMPDYTVTANANPVREFNAGMNEEWIRQSIIAVNEAQNRLEARENSPMARAKGALGDIGGNILGGLANIFNPMAMAGTLVNSVLEKLGPQMEKLVVAMEPIVSILAALLTPALEVLAKIIERAAKIILWFMEAVGWVVRGLGKLLNALPGSLGDPLVKAGQAVIDFADNARKGMETTSAGLDTLTESVLGAVNGFKTAGYRHRATIPGGGSGGGTGPGSVSPPTGTVVVPITINSSGDGVETLRNLALTARRLSAGRGPQDPFKVWADSIPVGA